MLRNGYAYEGKTSWNESHMNYLRELTMPCSSQKSILEEYLIAVTDGTERVARIEAHMERELEDWHLKPVVEALMAFKGLSLLRRALRSPFGDFMRFARGSQNHRRDDHRERTRRLHTLHSSQTAHELSGTCFQRTQ